ncbi:tRNA nucleotidyltransferase/poly(A) polymerase family protein [Hydrogenimonas cancrithermarum]|uniref:Multifunctional CCA protein n=1 Tax=Hydrogenimonas cancrithermarum TaxID=2993563 RepID=A0ABM8FJA2_9BACT|nr:CCA tRNA nucleotidyltransferase [Hydrogenimonas cancrithermarum]BDY11695.1 multifunctional CCA protein [Hydrogenimonas cancrithermarum]
MKLSLDRLSPDLANRLEHVLAFFGTYYPDVKLYLVGGAVRDMVLGRDVYDLDIECFGIEPERFDEAMRKLGAKGVGKSFYVYKYEDLDIALPRIERKTGRGHRAFSVELAYDTKEASRRRDFTMNALMLDLQSFEIIDHWGGLDDIENRLIRVVDPVKFKEDSLRVLRAMQFSARLKFRIEPTSRDLMRGMELSDLTPERIFWEFEKMFHAPWLHYGLFAMGDLLIARKILNLSFGRSDYIKMARHMQKARRLEDGTMRPYYFLFILSSDLHRSAERLCESIHTPNVYRKILRIQKRVPHHITDRFLGALSLRFPIRQWLGIYAGDVATRARRLGVYAKQFDPGIRPADLLEEGFSGKALGRELRRRILAAVRNHFGVDR